MRLRVSENRRYLVREDGKPFFYLGDTAWELFHRLTLEESEHYLRTRARQGFTVIQAVALAELDGLTAPTPQGHLPLHNHDPSTPNEEYFAHVDRVVRLANELGLVVGFLPTWGDKVNKKWGVGPEIFTPNNAREFGQFLGRRYRDADLIWILGGDRPVESDTHLQIWRAMAEGLQEGDGGSHLRSYHPAGFQTSAERLHAEPWLDFNMLQSGHGGRHIENYRMVDADYRRTPTKPCMDAEPNYEDHPVNWKPDELGWFDERDVRRSAYWAVFAGAHGHTYGCHDVWQMWAPGRQAVAWARTPWRDALELPGASQMRFLARLMLSRPFLTRIPDQSLIVGEPAKAPDHVRATRDSEGSYAFVYIPTGRPTELDLSALGGGNVRGAWFNPRTGIAHATFEIARESRVIATPPTADDWVLVVDRMEANYALP